MSAATENAPLSGVFHLAGATADHAFDQLTAKDFAAVFGAKARGAQVLARAVLDAQQGSGSAGDGGGLTAFVLFSSAAGLLGSAGQANYGAANGFLDGLAHSLRAEGVPATTVDWGPWVAGAKGGMAANPATARAAEKAGISILTDAAAAPILALAAAGASERLLAIDADFKHYAEQAAGHPRVALLEHLLKERSRPEPSAAEVAAGAASSGSVSADEAGFGGDLDPAGRRRGWLRDLLRPLDADERYDLARDTVRGFAGDLLGDPSKVDDDCGFEEMDMDSIMMIDLGDLLSHAMDDDLSAVVAINYPTIQELSRHLTTLVPQAPAAGPAETVPEPSAAAIAAVTDLDAPLGAGPAAEAAPEPGDGRELSQDELIAAIRRDLAMDL